MSIKVGDRVGKLVVIARAPKLPEQTHYMKRWEVQCDCGTRKVVWQGSLKVSVSCGCVRRERAKENIKKARAAPRNQYRTHGMTREPIWNIWVDMRKRCRNPNAYAYERYGGRGISVCARWEEFANFFEDMGDRPSPKHTLDRIDNDGDYCKENCRWATRKEQARNRSSNRMLQAFGKTMTLAEWSIETGLNATTITRRIDFARLSVEDALSRKLHSRS